MARPFKVALLIETSSSYGRGLLRGISRYAGKHGPWSFFLEPGGQDEHPPPLRDWGVDGVITLFRT
ncbi:MAG TPA: xylose operon transcription regulator XylR, partial [Planctomycetota bacterium]|nr:xylose operon transcription regulator XylR [Planctomycetota bacterium]